MSCFKCVLLGQGPRAYPRHVSLGWLGNALLSPGRAGGGGQEE